MEDMEIERAPEIALIGKRMRTVPAVAIIGPRQCGKTTLAHQIMHRLKGATHVFDLENPRHLAELREPLTALEHLSGTIVIDEVQRRPELFPVLRVLIDAHPKQRYLILGSASRDLLKQSSETLAGRISYIEIGGLTTQHVPQKKWHDLWQRGGFPCSYLARNGDESVAWREDFIQTFLERDVPSYGMRIPTVALRRFWTMIAHYHGQMFNASEIGRSIDVSHKTAKQYLDVLTGTFMIRQLSPWHYNTKKRLTKRPKIYIRDTGILHVLLSILSEKELRRHPVLGASWEGFVIEQIVRLLRLPEEHLSYWGTHAHGELDFIFQRKGKLWGVECKFKDAPRMTKTLHTAMEELDLAHIWIVYPGDERYVVHKNVTCLPLAGIGEMAG